MVSVVLLSVLTASVFLHFPAVTVCRLNAGRPPPRCDSCYDHEAVKVRHDNETINEFIERLFYDYHSLIRPINQSDPSSPTQVGVNLFINSFGHISVHNMEYSIDVFVRQHWNEPRLQFAGLSVQQIALGYYIDKMWTPDLFFRNSKRSKLHNVTKPNFLIFLKQNGDILFSQKVSLTLSCPMVLAMFPMDTQTCSIEIGSYGYTLAEVNMSWLDPGDHENNIQFNTEVNLNEFDLPQVNTYSCIKEYKTTGGFACIRADLRLCRRFNFYLIHTYLPSSLIVGVSWLAFFIDFTVVPARITLGLLSMLTLMTQSTSTIQSLPRVSYVKALDVWLFTCLAFVASTLIEFAIVSAVCQEDELQGRQGTSSRSRAEQLIVLAAPDGEVDSEKRDNQQQHFGLGDNSRRRARRFRFPKKVGYQVDRVFLVGFPIAFLLFNLVYWIFYDNAHRLYYSFK